MKILIVSDNISMKMGGEASLPYYYFKLFRERDLDVYCICHERVKAEVISCFAKEEVDQRFTFIQDTGMQASIYRFSQHFPPRINYIINQLTIFSTMRRARIMSKKIIKQQNIDVVFEPAPITPKGLSFMYGLHVPVVIGPLCGGLEFPPAFAKIDSIPTRIIFQICRTFSVLMHHIFPGKLQADVIVVANARTENALPNGIKGKVYHVAESGVDLDIWKPSTNKQRDDNAPIRFVYSGRFVDWKGIRYLVDAFVKMAKNTPARLDLIGAGELFEEVKEQVKSAGIESQVVFHGWVSREESAAIIRECDVFVMPSIRECGGTAILEAMAIGLPAIVTNWCGPAQYVTPDCGILVSPDSHEAFVQGLADAMSTLTHSAELRTQMGNNGKRRVLTEYFDWNSKAERMIEVFEETIKARAQVSPGNQSSSSAGA
jgi:glycosyltransferase involved in cell wall biosynthesis